MKTYNIPESKITEFTPEQTEMSFPDLDSDF